MIVRAWTVPVAIAMIVLSALAPCLPSASGQCSDASLDIWVYDYSEEYEDDSMQMSISGNLTVTRDMTGCITLDDESVDVIIYHTFMLADVSGSARYETFTGAVATADLRGTYRVDFDEYHDLSTDGLLRVASNETLDVDMYTGDPASFLGEYIYYHETNETDYELWATDPETLDVDAQGLELEVGATWEVESISHSLVTGVIGDAPFEEEWDLHEVTEYRLTGFETITGPSGTHECMKIEHSDGEANATEWYCPDIDADAKLQLDLEDDHVTWTLLSYEPGDEEGSDEDQLLDGISNAWLAVGVLVPVAAVCVTVVAYVLTRRRDAGKEPPPAGDQAP